MKKILLFIMLGLFVFRTASAQTNPVEGVVLSAVDGEPLIGVSVVIKGTTTGTMTNVDGVFSLNASPEDILVFSYLGYMSQEIQVGTSRHLNVLMNEDTSSLDEVVVIGYGVQKKSVVTAAISKVTADDLRASKPSRIEDVLKGKVSGVQITQSSGQPGSDSKVRIRGTGSEAAYDDILTFHADGKVVYQNNGNTYLNESFENVYPDEVTYNQEGNPQSFVTTQYTPSDNATWRFATEDGILNLVLANSFPMYGLNPEVITEGYYELRELTPDLLQISFIAGSGEWDVTWNYYLVPAN